MPLPKVEGNPVYYKLAAAEHHGKYGVILVNGSNNGVTPIGPCESSTADAAMHKFRGALEKVMGPYVHPDHKKP